MDPVISQALTSIGLSLGFLVANTILELTLVIASGVRNKDWTHRVVYTWIEKSSKKKQVGQAATGQDTSHRTDQKTTWPHIQSLMRDPNNTIEEIWELGSLKPWTYPSLSLNLCITALGTYAAALLNRHVNATTGHRQTLVILFIAEILAVLLVFALNILAVTIRNADETIIFSLRINKASVCRLGALFLSFAVTFYTFYVFWSYI